MHTQYRSAKSSQDLVLAGVTIASEQTNGSFRSVTLTDANGRVLKFSSPYGLEVYVPAEPKKEDKHVVTGTVVGVPVREVFDSPYEAQRRQDEIEGAGGDVTVTVESVEIPF